MVTVVMVVNDVVKVSFVLCECDVINSNGDSGNGDGGNDVLQYV